MLKTPRGVLGLTDKDTGQRGWSEGHTWVSTFWLPPLRGSRPCVWVLGEGLWSYIPLISLLVLGSAPTHPRPQQVSRQHLPGP